MKNAHVFLEYVRRTFLRHLHTTEPSIMSDNNPSQNESSLEDDARDSNGRSDGKPVPFAKKYEKQMAVGIMVVGGFFYALLTSVHRH